MSVLPEYSSNVVFTPERLAKEVEQLGNQGRFVFDIETTGTYRGEPVVNQLVWMSFASYGQTFVLPLGHPNGNRLLEPARKRKDPITKKFVTTEAKWDDPPEQMRPGAAFDILRPLFMDKSIEKGGFGALFDFLSTPKYLGGLAAGPYHDAIVAIWLLNENLAERGNLGLKPSTERVYKRKYDKENVGRRVEIHPFNKVATYAYLDAKYTWLHLENCLAQLDEEGLRPIYDLEMQVFEALLGMGQAGTEVDIERMKVLEVTLSERRTEIEGKIYRAAGKKFNLNSPKQKVDMFYGPKGEGNQGLKPWRLTKGGMQKDKDGQKTGFYDWSTDKEALSRFEGNPVVDNVLAYQEVDRVLGTYIQGYLGTDEKPTQIFDGRVYPDFVQYGTVTGRFSCRAPNLQNIPRPDTELGKIVRSLFVAKPGHCLVVADYGQIELVVLAHFVGKGALYDGFYRGIDPHTMTAAMVFQHDPETLQALVNKEDREAKNMRQAAKAINFAVVYGAGPDKVASMAKVKVRRAKEILQTHEVEFPEVYKFKDDVLRTARSRKPPHVTTLMGRKRRIPALMSREYKVRGSAERKIVNSLIQGSAADLIKLAMVRLHQGLAAEDAGTMTLSVHDELVVETPIENRDKCERIVREAMTGDGIQKWVDVPLSIDMHTVEKWADAK